MHGLLLEDVTGHKLKADGKYSDVLVFRGSLLQTLADHDQLILPSYDPPHNYRTLADLSDYITLYCRDDQVKVLSTVQKNLLCGIQNLGSRLEVLDKLYWAETLEIGSLVNVTLPSNHIVKAAIQYIGEIYGIFGHLFGLKLQVCVYIVIRAHGSEVCGNIDYFYFLNFSTNIEKQSVALLEELNISNVNLVMACL